MEGLTQLLLPAVQTVNSYLSDYVLLFLLVGTGLFFTVKTGFIQVRCLGEGFRQVFGGLSLRGKKQQGGMSSFQALATAIAAQVGTGNIVGASGAILLGGPGAIFWMWVIAFFGMATIYAEAVLAQKTRVRDAEGQVLGGPVYYIRAAFPGGFGRFLAGFFAVAIILALGFLGCMVQSNSIGAAFKNAFGIPVWMAGAVLVVLSGFIFFGGTQRLASVTEKLVPAMAGLYLLGSLAVLAARRQDVGEGFLMIFRYALSPQAILGGSMGAALKAAVSQGAKRGLFANEAGMGSTPHAHALANVKTPHQQGCVAMVGVFIGTFCLVTITALVIIVTMYAGGGPLSAPGVGAAAHELGLNQSNLAQTAYSTVFGETLGTAFIAVALFFFAFSTILSWNLFGKLNAQYLWGRRAVMPYTLLSLAFLFLGTVISADLVWGLADLFNQLMVLPNVIGLLGCAGTVKALIRKE
ncbi:MAG: sodium:alanine symporter family protein [Clostridia bacterium]|nr:sodium:alanine symporter family protein [Clostridia bacterium]